MDRPETTFRVFQFPADKIPRIDGDTSDWDIVPDAYVIGSDQLADLGETQKKRDPADLDVRVRVGWVNGLNRLYFLYEATDNYWDFSSPGIRNDTFEVIVDGDASGGPLIDSEHRDFWTPDTVGPRRAALDTDPRITDPERHWAGHGVHAQNYHIFTPAAGKDWALAWGASTWTKNFPHANAATRYDFKHGEPGKLTLEFYITLYDYAGPEGPQRAIESALRENKIIGLGWIIIDYDGDPDMSKRGFWSLGRHYTMFGDASALPAFRLMPLEKQFQKPIDARWTFTVVDMDRRLVAFKDESTGEITKWHWDFGDGATSTDQHPQHTYAKPGNHVVILDVEGPAGKSRLSKVWDVQLR
ncbi:MAG: PKD domain-containing protein [Opitutaceae bacterium]|nr:PKD domain-containing protein [Opitutaceae bacterium]